MLSLARIDSKGNMKKLLIAALLWGGLQPCFAQLTQKQKVSDFLDLAALYDKDYGPYQWKVEVFDYDLLNLQPWLDQIYTSTDDLAFYDICVRYVASLHDFHDEFTLPSFYEAYLPLTADIYDGRVLVDFVDTTVLDPASYPISIGDEIVSVDNISAANWISILSPYSVNGQGNPVSRNRLAVASMLDRYQGWYTYASNIQPGQVATLVIRSANGRASYSIPWSTIGLPLFSEGPVPNPSTWSFNGGGRKHLSRSMRENAGVGAKAWGIPGRPPASAHVSTSSEPADPRKKLRNFGRLHPSHALAGGLDPFGSLFPLFNPPPGFQLRLGFGPNDNFLSGTFPVGQNTVGFIRIPTFEPSDETAALYQFAAEIAYFQQNTTGLVIDVMSNGGGDICYAQELVQYVNSTPFRSLGFSLRATENWLEDFEESLLIDEESGAPQSAIDQDIQNLQQVQQALARERGMTPPLPLCSSTLTTPPATDQNGNNLAYTKPILVLTNNFTASAAEMFSATLQDATRAKTYGTRTSGGGNVVSFNSAPYAEGSTRVTESIAVRNHNVSTPGYPSAPYIENIGVYPDLLANYQTKDNLLNGGAPFVAGFTAAIANLIGSPQP
jgi:hypothetical protein